MTSDPRRFALVRLSALGDVVHALPVAAALRRHRPDAWIAWVVERREAALLRGHPALDAVIEMDSRAWRRAAPRAALAAFRDARRRLASFEFDAAIDLQGLVKSGIVTRATRARLRIGFSAGRCRERLNTLFTNRRVMPGPECVHAVDQYLALLRPLGVTSPRVEFDLPRDEDAEARVDDFFAGAGLKPRQRLVALNPGAGNPDKRWPPARFGALARRLAGEGLAVLVTWGPGEEAPAREIAATGGAGVTPAPPTNLFGLLAVLRRASVVVAGDTGPLHLAAALGRPCVGLYAPPADGLNGAARTGPYGAGHRIVQSTDGTMDGIGVEPVATAASELVEPARRALQ